MTDVVPFVPTISNPPFQFQATLDDVTYVVQVRWNITGQRWYVFVYDQTNTLVVTLPLIGSPSDDDISLTAGYFTTPLVYRSAIASFEVG